MNVATFATQLAAADGDRRRRRLRAVHRHPAPAQPAARHDGPRLDRARRSTPPAAPCCSPAPPCASRSSACARSASASSTASPSAPSIAVALTMVASLTLLPAVLVPARPAACCRASCAAPCGPASSSPRTRPTRWARWSAHRRAAQLALGTGRRRRDRRAGDPVLLDAARPRRPEQRPDGTTTRDGLRPDRARRLRHGLQLRRWNWSSTARRPPTAAYLERWRRRLEHGRRRRPDSDPARQPIGRDLALVTFKTTTSPQDPKTTDLVNTLRSRRRAGAGHGHRRTRSTSSARPRSSSTSRRCSPPRCRCSSSPSSACRSCC